jgi:hypothetical protein
MRRKAAKFKETSYFNKEKIGEANYPLSKLSLKDRKISTKRRKND